MIEGAKLAKDLKTLNDKVTCSNYGVVDKMLAYRKEFIS